MASDGYRLKYRHWEPTESVPKTFVVALHGIQSHGGWYEMSSRHLCEAGYDVRFLDRRGSGMNLARRGDAAHADRLVNDVVQFLEAVKIERNCVAPNAPIVLLAVSWGGKLAAVTAARRPELVNALALLYPGLCARVQPTGWQRFQLNLARLLDVHGPRVEVPLNDPALFTGQPTWQEFIRRDSLALREVSVGFLLAHQDLTCESLAAAEHIRCPVLMMLAGRDRIIDNAASKQWLMRVGSGQVILYEFPNAQHTLEFEPTGPGNFVEQLAAWIDTETRHFSGC